MAKSAAKKIEDTEAEEIQPEKKKSINIQPSARKETPFVCIQHTIIAPAAHKYGDYLDPHAYASIAENFKPWHEITIIAEDNSFWAHLLVTSVSRQWVGVLELSHVDLKKAKGSPMIGKEDESAEYEVQWKGPLNKHCVIRKADGSIVQDGFETAPEALVSMAGHIRAIGR